VQELKERKRLSRPSAQEQSVVFDNQTYVDNDALVRMSKVTPDFVFQDCTFCISRRNYRCLDT
jgi:hypothetical protein